NPAAAHAISPGAGVAAAGRLAEWCTQAAGAAGAAGPGARGWVPVPRRNGGVSMTTDQRPPAAPAPRHGGGTLLGQVGSAADLRSGPAGTAGPRSGPAGTAMARPSGPAGS